MVIELSNGRGSVAWIEGEPGIGKSLLVDAGLADVAQLGMRVYRAVGDEFAPAFALRFLAHGLLAGRTDEFRTEIVDLLAGRGDGLDAVLAASDRMVALIERECARSPVAFVADDIQWADEASFSVLRRLADVTEQAPLLLVIICRPLPQRSIVDHLRFAVLRRQGGVNLELGPLGDEAVAEMAAALLGNVPGPRLRGLLSSAAGNPLYVRELIDALIADGIVQVLDGIADVPALVRLDITSLSAAIRRRLGFLSSEARSVLRAGAVLGVRFTVAEWALVSGRPVPDLAAIVDEALRAGILAVSGSELTFRHPLIRQALHDEVPAAMRAGLHSHAARELADANASWDRVARHLLAAPATIDGWAVDWLAGIPSMQLLALPEIAADLLDRARQATMPGDPKRGAFTARLTAALRLLRRPEALVALGSEALATVTEPEFVGEIAWNLARGYQMIPGRGQDGMSVIDRVLRGPDPGVPWRSRLHAQHALLLATTGRTAESVAEAALAIDSGERDADSVTIGWALIALLQSASGTDALDVVERGVAVMRGDDPEAVDLRLLFLANQLVVLSDLNRPAEFEAALPGTMALAEHLGTARITEIQLGAAYHFSRRGEWDQALLYVGQVEARTPYQALSKHGIEAFIHAHRGDFAAVAAHLSVVADFSYTAGIDYMIAAEHLIVARALAAEARRPRLGSRGSVGLA